MRDNNNNNSNSNNMPSNSNSNNMPSNSVTNHDANQFASILKLLEQSDGIPEPDETTSFIHASFTERATPFDIFKLFRHIGGIRIPYDIYSIIQENYDTNYKKDLAIYEMKFKKDLAILLDERLYIAKTDLIKSICDDEDEFCEIVDIYENALKNYMDYYHLTISNKPSFYEEYGICQCELDITEKKQVYMIYPLPGEIIPYNIITLNCFNYPISEFSLEILKSAHKWNNSRR
jgi:hypothetical protein